jgi:putative transposase
MCPFRIKGTSMSFGSVVRGINIGVAKWFEENLNIPLIWQRIYYEHIVREEEGLDKIREYIIATLLNWEKDDEYKTWSPLRANDYSPLRR